MEMRKSRVLRKLRGDQTANCIKLNLADPRGVELAAMSGFDCVWVDMEHVPSDYQFIENAVRASKLYDCDLMTRVSKGCYSDLIRPLEADTTAIMVPHLMSLEEAKEIVYNTKFYPIGRRPVDGGNADAKFCNISGKDYIRQANEQRFIVVQIEDPEPLIQLEEICALPGIDMIFFGPGDFSQGIGTPFDFSNPMINETRRLIARTAAKYGKFSGTTGSTANYAELVAEGYNFINVGADVIGLAEYYKNITARL
jgi:4-hydroxy-2-oxoheptanedioate aldolase